METKIDYGDSISSSNHDQEQAVHDQLPSVEEAWLSASQHKKGLGCRRCVLAVIGINALLLIAVIVGVSVGLTRSPDDASVATSPVKTDGSDSSQNETSHTTMADFPLISDSFESHDAIPSEYTSDGEDVSPPLSWSDAPEDTESYALIVVDPDAPDPDAPDKTPFTHWVLYNIPADTSELAEGISNEELPEGTLEALNDWSETGYRGPDPPVGKHRYFFRLYALDTVLPDMGEITRKELLSAMREHQLGMGELIGTYAAAGSD